MTDICLRLNNATHYERSDELACRCYEAADEIKQLRSALNAMLTFYGMDEEKGEMSESVHQQARNALPQPPKEETK